MNAVNTLCEIAENPTRQQIEIECVRNIEYQGTVIDSDTDPKDIHARDAATLTVETASGEIITLIYTDNGSHTSNPTSVYVRTETGKQYEIDIITEIPS